MSKTNKRSLIALILALAIIVSMAACKSEPEPMPQDDADIAPQEFVFLNPLALPDGTEFIAKAPKLTALVAEYDAMNSDTVAWLQVPGTSIDDVIVHYPGDKNSYYLRRNFEKKNSFNGSYFADYRNTFDGTWQGLSQNTVIYGHSMEDDPDAPLFSQLKKYLDEDFARENPYIYFSTEEQDLVFEIFAVSYATTDLKYNRPDLTQEEFSEIISEMVKRSVYTYNTQVTANDKILTLSTCTYHVTTSYPNKYRYVIMARLVGEDEELRQEASFTVNPSPKAP